MGLFPHGIEIAFIELGPSLTVSPLLCIDVSGLLMSTDPNHKLIACYFVTFLKKISLFPV